MKRKKLLSVVLLLFVLISSFVIRMVDLLIFHHGIPIFRNYNDTIIIRTDSLNELSVILLSVVRKLLKNEAVVVFTVNFVCQMMIVILCYFILSKFCNIYISGIVSMIVSIVLWITENAYVVLNFYLYVIGILILTFMVCFIIKRVYLKKGVFHVKSLEYQDEYLYEEIDSVITLDDILEREKQHDEMDSLISHENVQEASLDMTKIQIEKEEKKIQFIENPLPVPKKKEHKQMGYAIDILDESDDFDIIDMNGMDFFDVE